MSQVTKQEIIKIASLAKIQLDDEDIGEVAKKLTSIITWVESLNSVNTDDVEALTNVNNQTLRLQKDEVTDGDIATEVLANSQHAKYDYFAVPKVLE